MEKAVDKQLGNDFGSEHLNELAKQVISLFNTLDSKDRKKVLWMLQGYNLGQEKDEERQ